MNNSTDAAPSLAAQSEILTQEFQELAVENYAAVCSLTVLVYSTLLRASDEVNHLWARKITLPSILYILCRYATIVFLCSSFVTAFISPTASLSTCDTLATFGNWVGVFAYLGLQGLLVARGYALARESFFIVIFPVLLYLSGLVLSIYESAAFPGCIASESAVLQRGIIETNSFEFKVINQFVSVNFTQGIIVIVTDTLVFLVTIVKLWRTFRNGLEAKVYTSSTLVSLFVRQGIIRYLFVVVVTITNTILLSTESINVTVSDAFTFIQNALSVIIICDFFLDLRQANERSNQSAHIETLSWSVAGAQHAIRRVHDTIVFEMGQLSEEIDEEPHMTEVV